MEKGMCSYGQRGGDAVARGVRAPVSRRRTGERRRVGHLIAIVDAALVGVGGVYLTTGSTVVTVIAAVLAVLLGALYLICK
jgi:hypothetical protein